METSERVKKAYNYLLYRGLITKQKDAADKIGCARVNVSRALNGDEQILTSSFLRRFARAFPDINADWLIYGNGEMLNETEQPINETAEPMTTPYGTPMVTVPAAIIEDYRKQLKEKDAQIKQLLAIIAKQPQG